MSNNPCDLPGAGFASSVWMVAVALIAIGLVLRRIPSDHRTRAVIALVVAASFFVNRAPKAEAESRDCTTGNVAMTSTTISSGSTPTTTVPGSTTSTSTTTTLGPSCAAAPSPVSAPTLTAGTNLALSNGSWGSIPNCTNAYTYSWQGSSSSSGPWTDLTGLSANSLTVGTDIACSPHDFVRGRVTATNAFGTATQNSAAFDLRSAFC